MGFTQGLFRADGRLWTSEEASPYVRAGMLPLLAQFQKNRRVMYNFRSGFAHGFHVIITPRPISCINCSVTTMILPVNGGLSWADNQLENRLGY